MAVIDLGRVVGPQGVQGETGATGPQGEKGDKGDAGTSVYEAAALGGFTGTPEELNQLLGASVQSADRAEAAAEAAETVKSDVIAAKTSAETAAQEAQTSASSAQTKAGEAAQSAQAAANAESNAASSATGAANSANAAAQSAMDAAASVQSITGDVEAARTAAEAADKSAKSASSAEQNVAKDAADAKQAAEQAVASAANAATSAASAVAANATVQNVKEYLDTNYSKITYDIEGVEDGIKVTYADGSEKEIPVSGGQTFDGMVYDQETGYLHILQDGEDVVDPVYIGGGGGSGGSDSSSKLTLTNTTGWLVHSIAQGADCVLRASWSSTEDDLVTGPGTLTVRVNNIVRQNVSVAQEALTIDVTDWLSTGSNKVRMTVTDASGNSKSLNFTITTIALKLASSFDAGMSYAANTAVTYAYTPTGAAEKTVYFVVDGQTVGTTVVATSGRQQSYSLPGMTHGNHTLLVYFTAEIDGETVSSNELYYDLLVVDSASSTPVIASSFRAATATQYELISIPYTVYTPNSLTSAVSLYVGNEEVSTLTVDRSEQVWSYRADTVGGITLRIVTGNVMRSFTFTVAASDMDIHAETNDLVLYLTTTGRSNSEDKPSVWKSGEISAVLTGFNFQSDGWRRDADGATALRVSGDARVTIPHRPFAQDFRGTGKTIEVEFATSNVLNYDAVIMSCMSGGRGVELTAQTATLYSEQSEISTQYKENEHVRITFVVEKRTENRLLLIYINGIMSGAVQYPDDDDFSQAEPVDISIGSNDCAIDVYCIRVYNNDLTRHQIVDNWIADTQSVDLMLQRYQHNDVYDAYGNIVVDKLPTDLPYLVLSAPELPQYKGDKKTVSGYYVDPADPSKSFTFAGASANVQGTSSQYYARKNYKISFKGGFTDNDGVHSDTYRMRDGAVPTDTFTFKADVASSEGANNVELVRLYNDACPYQTPPQTQNAAIRQGIDGFPIVIFWNNGATTSFVGKYNFNNDKGTPEVYGFQSGDESWEIKNNTSNRVLFKSGDLSDGWDDDFEARYPEDNEAIQNLQTFVSWVASTDQSAATGMALSPAVTYDGTRYAADTAAYRLAKFRAELADYAEVDALVFYYLFTELFLMVDSRAKNAFPTAFLSQNGKWFSLPYDFDTALGINNEGALVFSYNLEDIDHTDSGADVFNGQQSVLWINLRAAFFHEITAMYQTLRSQGKLSYRLVEGMFEDHQNKWPEAVFNEDAYFKYLGPLIDGTTDSEGNFIHTAFYLPMLQGSKTEQRKWWLYNRFRYIDSKYNAGDAKSDTIAMRGYAVADITVTPYADIYPAVLYGSYLATQRGTRNVPTTLPCRVDELNDTEVIIYSASQLKSVGDLSPLKADTVDVSRAVNLQSLKLGDSGANYFNENLKDLTLGSNVLLRSIDVRNCPNLTQAVDISGCVNVEEVYFGGTSITGLTLPNGGVLKTLELPGTIANLTIRNHPGLTKFTLPSYANISTLRIENTPTIDVVGIVNAIQPGSRVRLIGFAVTMDSGTDVLAFMDKLDTMRGLDESGNNMNNAQVSGTIIVGQMTRTQLNSARTRYPDVRIEASAIRLIVPTQAEPLTYNTAAQSPTWYDYDPDVLTIDRTPSETNAGTYTVTFAPKIAGDVWADGTSGAKNVTWTIAKATPAAPQLSVSSITLDNTVDEATFTVTRDGDGAVQADSGDVAVAMVSISGTTVTVTYVGNGTTAITVYIAEGTNYLAYSGDDVTCTVMAAVPIHLTANSLTRGRTRAGGSAFGNNAVIAGGQDGSTSLSSVEVYNLSLTHSAAPSLSSARRFLTVAATNHYLLAASGQTTSSDSTMVSTVDAYDTGFTLSAAPTLSPTRRSITGGSIGNYIIFAGGYTAEQLRSDAVDIYDASLTRFVGAKLSVARAMSAACRVGNYLLFTGGSTGTGDGVAVAVAEAYDMSLTRTLIADLQQNKRYHAATSLANFAIFAGGSDGAAQTQTVDLYNSALTHTIGEQLSAPRDYFAAAATDNYAYFAGGRADDEASVVVDTFNRALTRGIAGDLSQARTRLVAAQLAGQYVLFMGGSASATAVSPAGIDAVDVYTE